MEKITNVGGRLHNPAVGGALTGANEIKDDTKGKMQDVINAETDAELVRLDEMKQNNLSFDQTPTEESTNPVTSGGVYAADAALQQAIEAILLLIPSAATALNQLADKAFVNSSIATATATFRGTYNLVTDLGLAVTASHQDIANALLTHVATAQNNDYCFVQIPVSAQSSEIRVTERYKFDGISWSYEYDLNNSGFTAEQWAALNSGITSVLVSKLVALPTVEELAVLFNGKQNVLTFDNVPTAGSNNPVKSGGLYERFAAISAMTPTDANANNKLVAESRLVDYVTSVIETLNASYNITTEDGHVTLRLTQVDGAITSLQIATDDIASAIALTALGERVSTNERDIDNLQAAYEALTQSDIVIVNGALPSTGQQQNIIYRQPDQDHTPPQFYSDYMWNGTTWVLMATYNNAIDPLPKKGSQNLVASGGVFDNIGALDVSELNATENPHTLAIYANLSAAIEAIPSDYRKGGMSIKFVQTSDNNYVQWRCMADSFTTDVTQWQGVDSEIKDLSKNLIESGATAIAIKQRCALIQEFHKVWPGMAYNANNGRWGADANYSGVEMFFVYYNHKYLFNLPARFILHFDADGNFLRRKSFTTPITEYTAGYTDVVYIGVDINISEATSPIFTVKDITTTPIEDLQAEVASIHDDITSINDDIESISAKEVSGDAISITPLTPTMGSWVNNAAINTPLSFRENAGDTYGYIRIDLTSYENIDQILAHDFSCMVSTQSGLLVEAAFVNSNNVVIQLHTKESSSTAGGCANRTYNVPDGAAAVYLNYRSTDNTTAEYKTYTRKVGSSNLTSELLDKIKSKLQGKTLYNDGDSVAHGASGEVAYAEQIATLMGMTLTNAAVSGTTIGYKDSDPNYAQSIPERMIANLANNDYDYILFEGGFNDIAHCQIGEITEGFQPATIDPMTTIGGLEKVCQWLWLNKPTAKKLFVLGQKYNYNAQKPFWEAIISVLEKWGIPYVDIWRETQLIGYNSTNKARWYHNADGLHPNTAAYTNFFVNIIVSKLESL